MTAAHEHLERWQRELEDLRNTQVQLSSGWAAALADLQRAGLPPQSDLIDELAGYSRRWGSLSRELTDGTAPLGSLTFDDLSRICAEHALVRQAVAMLDQAAAWIHTTDADFEPLREIQSEAVRLREALLHRTASADQEQLARTLADGSHPLCELVRLQQSGQEIDDGEWDRLHDRVTEQFGRAMAIAIGRGRIQPGSTQDTAIPEKADSELTTADRKSPRNPAAQSEEPDFVFDFASAGTRMTGVLESVPDRKPPPAQPTAARIITAEPASLLQIAPLKSGVETKQDSGLLEAWVLLREQRAAVQAPPSPESGSAAADLAEAALSASDEERSRGVARLLEQLLIDDKLALAYQIAKVSEASSAQHATPLPASLIRACLVSRHCCYPQGEMHRYIEEDLHGQQPRRYQDLPPDDRLAYQFLCRAAALSPAALCSSSAAARLLQSFPIESGLHRLYNYASRIASYAERLQGRSAEMLQNHSSRAETAGELEELRQRAGDWLTQTIKQTMPTVRTSPLFVHAHWTVTGSDAQRSPFAAQLWSQWQETWLYAHRLLRPVIQGDAERAWVKHELERLSNGLRQAETRADRFEADEGRAAMRGVLRQAMEFAAGWLRLGGGGALPSSNLPTRELEELRSEIRERSADVLSELQPFAAIQKPAALRAAAFCLQRAIQRIQAIFAGEASLAWKEPELRHVLHGELLKIPNLPLNEQWEPQVEADLLQSELLEQIRRGSESFRDAFELNCRQGDHLATGRLLELPGWCSPAELAELTQLRNQRVVTCRRELQADLERLNDEFQARIDSGEIHSADQAILRRRLDRLQSAASRTLDFQIAGIQLQQLHLLLQRRNNWRGGDDPAAYGATADSASGPAAADTGDLVLGPESENSWVMDILWENR